MKSLLLREMVVIACSIFAAANVAGCKSDQAYHKEADHVAKELIAQKQKELKLEEPFTIETKDHTLRRELIIDQGLPHSSNASLSSQDVKRVDNFPGAPATRPSTQPTTRAAKGKIHLTLVDALMVGAHYSREYQTQKEGIFTNALALDLALNDFRLIFNGSVNGALISDQTVDGTPNNGLVGATSLGVSRKFSNGATFMSKLTFDIVQMLTPGKRGTSQGIIWDTSITMPLLAGGGEAVVLEPLRQAERNVAYDLLDFQQYKRQFAVDVAQQYLDVLSQYDQISNAEQAYRRAISSTRRARRQADAGRLPEIQVDQSVQQELRSRERWIQAQINMGRRLDSFKWVMGLPPDADIALEAGELRRLNSILEKLLAPAVQEVQQQSKVDTQMTPEAATTSPSVAEDLSAINLPPLLQPPAGSLMADENKAVEMALKHRPDLLVQNGRVLDAQRKVVVAANALQAGMTLEGRALVSDGRGSLTDANNRDGRLNWGDGIYSGRMALDLPLERTAERNAYRESLIRLEQYIRNLQQTEDSVKADVRSSLRNLALARESIQIQAKSVAVAQKRVDSTNLFLDAGRAQVRDVLEAQDALVQAQNGLTSALIGYRVAELSLQRDMGLLQVDDKGLWTEYEPVLAGREQLK